MKIIYPEILIKNTLEDAKEESCIFSPNSIFSIFSPLSNALDWETKYALNSLFSLEDSDKETYEKSFKLFDGQLKKDTKLFLKKEYLLRVENQLGCCLETIDEKDPHSRNIPDWVKEYASDSNGTLFNSSSINNVVDFNSKWQHFSEIKESNTQIFSKESGENVENEFINLDSNFNYIDAAELEAEILELPLFDDDFSAFCILPHKNMKISDVENKLNSCILEECITKMEKLPLEISIPKLKFTKICDISSIFNRVRYQNSEYKLYTYPNAQLGKMLTRTYIEVNETGIKGCATSGFELIWQPIIKEMLFETNISNRFAKTVVTSKIENLENISQEASFTMALPQNAFISEFLMIIKEKTYKSYVREKKEAKIIFDEAVASGKSAAHVAVNARDSNNFTVSVSIEPLTEAIFVLTYEELLERRYEEYELILNINPGQLVHILKILVKIDESRKLKYVKTPPIRSGKEITDNLEEPDTLAKTKTSNSQATITFEPNIEYQKKVARIFENTELSGFSGQFVVQYDVELDPTNGEVIISDGYFVHFYAPDDLPPMAKHVAFSLDTSGSMSGSNIDQLKDAMRCILDQVRNNDLVDIVEFNSSVIVHNLETETTTEIVYNREENYHEPFYKYEGLNLAGARPYNEVIKEKSKKAVDGMRAGGSTHGIGGLETALYLTKLCQEMYSNYQPMIVFLTDGYPNEGISNVDKIVSIITKLNHKNYKVPIFSLSFGDGADKNFLRQLSLNNFGFSRHIYEASDASLQLRQFYKQISSPLLSNVTFKYDSNVEGVTRINFPIYFRGSDIVICGKYKDSSGPTNINLNCQNDCVALKPTVNKTVMQLERLWAYLTIKQLLEQREHAEDTTEMTKRAVDLALKYSFVTEVTSLVVVKPELETASGAENRKFVSNFALDELPEEIETTCFIKACEEELKIQELEIEPPKMEKPKPQFKANRPFLILIQAKLENQNATLFVGRITCPVYEQ